MFVLNVPDLSVWHFFISGVEQDSFCNEGLMNYSQTK
jgi:hypothetical protein